MKMLQNILYIHPCLGENISGSEISLLYLLRYLDRKRFNPLVVCSSDSPLRQELEKVEIAYWVVAPGLVGSSLVRENLISFVRMVRFLSVFIARNHVTLVHVNSLTGSQYGILASKLSGVPCVLHSRDILRFKLDRFSSLLLNSAEAVVACSSFTRQTLIDAGIHQDRIRVILNPAIDPEEARDGAKASGRVRKELAGGKETPLVGLIARIVRYKRHEDFIRAASEVIKKMPNVKFLIIGDIVDEEYFRYLNNLVKELKLNNRVIFVGFRHDILSVIGALDVVVLCSVKEAFGRVLIEAMAMGKPIVATDSGGIRETVVHGETGILVPDKDPYALSRGILDIILDKDMAETLGKNGQRKAFEHFSIEAHVRAVESLYENILSEA